VSFFRFIIAEIFHSKRFVALFLINLSLGLTSFSALEFLKSSIDTTVMEQSRQVLGADFGLSSRREFLPEELKIVENKLPKNFKSTPMIEMFSMVSKGTQSSLVQLKAVELSFPFYGQIITEPQMKTSFLEDTDYIWVYPEILTLLNVRIGESLKIGDRKFKIAAIVKDDASSGISTNMAPRIYISLHNLAKTNLMKPGTLAWHSILYKIPFVDDNDLEKLRDDIYKDMSASDIQVFTHRNSSEQMNRLLNYLSDFLGLVSLSALFIACIGLTFLLSTYLQGKSKSIAILIALGYSKTKAINFYFIQLLFLVLIGSLISLILATIALPLVMQASQSLASFPIRLHIDFRSLATSLSLGLVGGLCLLLPHLVRLRQTHPNILLRGLQNTARQFGIRVAIWFLPAVILFYILSIRQMNSLRNGSIFFFSFLGAGTILYVISYYMLPLMNSLPRPKWTPLAWAIRDISRLRTATVTGFLSLALGAFLVNIVPQIKANLQAEIQKPPSSRIPSLFLFDIQSEQVGELKNILSKESVPVQNISPLIRARLIEVNGNSFNKGDGAFSKTTTRENERESQFRNRGFNLSYRETLDTSETIVTGTTLPNQYPNPDILPEISLEERFADRLQLKMGDILTFDIQDTPIQGKVTSLRRVTWTSFQPNFFVLFQNGSLEDAPKTFLATIPKLTMEQKLTVQKKIVQKLPNISLIDVDRLIEKLIYLIEQMGWALQVMSIFCIFVGLAVLFALANDQVRSREWDIGLLKALGASYSTIAWCFVLQFLLMSTFAAICGGLLSLVASFIFSSLLFDGAWFFNGIVPLVVVFSMVFISPLLIYWSIHKGLEFSPRELLSRGS
jgi:putative ABC transport system permease protein